MAQKVDHRNVRFPNPTKALINRIAASSYSTFVNEHVEMDGLPRLYEWGQLSESRKQVWRQIARASFATLAKAAGAKITKI